MEKYTEAEKDLITKKLKSFRQVVGLRPYQAAEYLSTSKIRYSQIESGEVFPSDAEIDKLCDFIKFPKSWIRNSEETLRDFEQLVYDKLQAMQSRKVEYREEAPKKLGAKIKIVRETHYLTLDQMANILGLTYKLYCSYENSSPNLPRVYFDKITALFRIPEYWLLDDHISVDAFESFYKRWEQMQAETIISQQHYRCKVDKEGGIHLPYAVCKLLQLTPTTNLIATPRDDGTLQISKAWKTCWFCGSSKVTTTYQNYVMCKSCIKNMGKLVK